MERNCNTGIILQNMLSYCTGNNRTICELSQEGSSWFYLPQHPCNFHIFTHSMCCFSCPLGWSLSPGRDAWKAGSMPGIHLYVPPVRYSEHLLDDLVREETVLFKIKAKESSSTNKGCSVWRTLGERVVLSVPCSSHRWFTLLWIPYWGMTVHLLIKVWFPGWKEHEHQ